MSLPDNQTLLFDKKTVSLLPSLAGIYLFCSKKDILYIGKSVNIKARVTSHIENAKLDLKEHAIVSNTSFIKYIPTDSEFNALILESRLIQTYKPQYNARWKDDKSYLYIKITVKDEYPKILSTRQETYQKNVLYYGPFSSNREVEIVLKEIRKVFPFCTQKKTGKKACFYSKIGLCNPCPSDIEKIKDPELKKKVRGIYKKNVRRVIQILSGKTDFVLRSLYVDLKKYTSSQRYEDAIVIRNRIQRFEYLIHQRSFQSGREIDHNRSEQALQNLIMLLHSFYPELHSLHRIECYDMSNTQLKQATASMVVAKDGLPDRGEYRRFKIRNPKAQSDFEMIEEVLKRRLKNNWPKPDLLVIDGGKPQVKTVSKVLREVGWTIPFIGIAKHPDRFVIGISPYPTIRPQSHHLGFNLIRNLRDESHRFAKKYHLLLRDSDFIPRSKMV